MPQMAPMYWELLFILFIIMYMIMNTISFFNFNSKMNKCLTTNEINNKNWKW